MYHSLSGPHLLGRGFLYGIVAITQASCLDFLIAHNCCNPDVTTYMRRSTCTPASNASNRLAGQHTICTYACLFAVPVQLADVVQEDDRAHGRRVAARLVTLTHHRRPRRATRIFPFPALRLSGKGGPHICESECSSLSLCEIVNSSLGRCFFCSIVLDEGARHT